MNGESNLDLQYGMALVTGAQKVTLYQVGDLNGSQLFSAAVRGPSRINAGPRFSRIF